jgi:hypothetical protein
MKKSDKIMIAVAVALAILILASALYYIWFTGWPIP